MPFDERYSEPREGHALVCVDEAGVTSWCLRCGVLWRNEPPAPGRPPGAWQIPDQSGSSRTSYVAPPCLPSTGVGELNPSADARLMLRALTHGWRCAPVLLPEGGGTEAWRWTRDTVIGLDAYSVPGAWANGPVVDEPVRKLLLVTSA